jgi:hypothetical protein
MVTYTDYYVEKYPFLVEVFENSSTIYCTHRFGHYGRFATLLLQPAIEASGRTVPCLLSSLKMARGDEYRTRTYSNYIKRLDCEGSDLFTPQELYFLLQISGSLHVRDRPLRLEEREHILRETGDWREMVRDLKHITKGHCEALLKAWQFWDENYDSNYGVWMQRIRAMPRVYTQGELAWLLEHGKISPAEAASGVICPDEGYSSE